MSADDELYFTFDLGKNDSINANFDLEENNNLDANFNIYAAGTTWGSILGDITKQQDLTIALNLKADKTELNSAVLTINNRIDNLETSVDTDIERLDTNINNLTNVVDNNFLQLSGNIGELANTVSTNNITINSKVDNINTSLTNRINTLSGTVASNYTILDTKINNTANLLESNISELTETVSNNYTSLTGAINTETTNRQNADNNLQSQIDALVVSSDVFDVVGTYAELEAYDISTVPVNDIIKVLTDSTHNNSATYYRCIENNGVKIWSYIGAEGAYYTKSESDNKFVAKTTTINGKALNNNITLTASDVGALPNSTFIPTDTSDLTNNAGFITGITSANVINALGYTPYDAANPNNYTSNLGTVTSVNNTQPDGNGNVTISIPSTTNFVTTNTDQYIQGTKGFQRITTSPLDSLNITTQAGGGILGFYNSIVSVGDTWYSLKLKGQQTRPAYNKSDIALLSDVPDISTKQDTLVSGTNIKTINNESILGSGNIDVSGGGGAVIDDNTPSTTTVYSSQKTQDLIDALVARIAALEANINGGNA